jgi:PKD repeat protein
MKPIFKRRRKLISLVMVIALMAVLLPLGAACGCLEEGIRANFSATPTSGTAPLEVQFTDESEGDVDDWEWDFNDDGTIDSTNQNPTYTYTSAGNYTVSLEVSGPDGSDTERKVDYITVSTAEAAGVEIETGSEIQVTSQTVQPSGGTIEITDSSSPLYGLKIEVPEAATEEDINFTVSYAGITDVSGLPESASVASKMISIETSGSEIWNEYKAFDEPITVTLPYDPSLVSGDEPVRFYYYDEENNVLDSAGFLSQDSTNHTITFYAGTFSDFVAIKLALAVSEILGITYTVDTGFRPATDGWFITNYGSYLRPGGNCVGMSSFADWYYTYKKSATGVDLYGKYIEGDPSEWRDDATAIQLATRAHMGCQPIYDGFRNAIWAKTTLPKSPDVALSWLHGMIVTGRPQHVNVMLRYANGTWDGSHSVLTYRYSNGRFDIYDPNCPGTAPGTDAQQIAFTLGTGFTRNYGKYNIFLHISGKLFHPTMALSQLYDSAEKEFKDDTFFPTVTLTSPSTTPVGTTPEDTDGDGVRDTSESKVTISGTITGGKKEITSTLLFINNTKHKVPVVSGSFSQEVPLLQGDDEIVILATDENTRSNWAGYLKDTIRCTASREYLTFTLTWGQDQSDVDLHVLEPFIETTEGRHIYYANMGKEAGYPYPYLDIDNTWGYGPEHYYAKEDMTLPNYPGPGKSLYGTYKFRVHYYADHDDEEENTQPITWHVTVRYLAYRIEATGEEFWFEDSWSGALTVESTSGTGDFYNAGASWASILTVEYPVPDPAGYSVPPPPQNQLP